MGGWQDWHKGDIAVLSTPLRELDSLIQHKGDTEGYIRILSTPLRELDSLILPLTWGAGGKRNYSFNSPEGIRLIDTQPSIFTSLVRPGLFQLP